MGKSLRNKSKLAARRAKRGESWYGVADADRTQRLSDRLIKRQTEEEAKVEPDAKKTDGQQEDEDKMEAEDPVVTEEAVKMEQDGTLSSLFVRQGANSCSCMPLLR